MNYHSKQWKSTAKQYRMNHPVCEFCEKSGVVTSAAFTSHIIPVEQGGEPYDEENLIALCSSHYHKRKEFIKHNPPTKIMIVFGPPGAGKTTYVKDHIQPGELVFDLDAIYRALTFQPEHVKPEEVEDLVFRIRDIVFDWMRKPNKVEKAFIISTEPEHGKRQELIKLFSATSILIDEKADVCKQRVKDRPNSRDWDKLIDDWFIANTNLTEKL